MLVITVQNNLHRSVGKIRHYFPLGGQWVPWFAEVVLLCTFFVCRPCRSSDPQEVVTMSQILDL